jgi:hypothetical protein
MSVNAQVSGLTSQQDSVLWAHILLMMLAFGVIFPTGMVLGVSSTVKLLVAVLIFYRWFGIDGTYLSKSLGRSLRLLRTLWDTCTKDERSRRISTPRLRIS